MMGLIYIYDGSQLYMMGLIYYDGSHDGSHLYMMGLIYI